MSKAFDHLVMTPRTYSALKEESPSHKEGFPNHFPSNHAYIHFNSLHRSKPTTSFNTLTFPLTPCGHSDFHREGGMFRLVIVYHNHIPAREGHLWRESDVRLGKKNEREALVSNRHGEIEN